ncbi:DEAD/DEAH box helicase [Acuticoccus sp. M5D2P5]|uniref:DEAD/DEAH box helicase n=1 Tax=Acuticoccus kalidii TaxID=2910977 RepID=UPI001F1DEED4|nr:DEAD/DEAH box helicase [Acuticoccus kalidii]MCF3933404.1 DEAD/DEAH box helicase [Acuticoccus kalidii]
MRQFSELGLAEPILRALSDEGYTNPTPIQAEVIPAMCAGQDILGTAQTGTGKTAAFVLPILDTLARERGRPQPKTCRALILAPTRELASQIADNVKAYGRHMRLSFGVVVGGVKPGPQIRTLSRGVDILIATPGRLEDHMGSGALSLAATKTVVLDEADQMLDLGFFPAIRRIFRSLPREHQTALLSATMPKEIRGLANDLLTNPAEIAVAPVSRPIEAIDQSVRHVDQSAKRDALLEILKAPDLSSAIVFTRTKRGADKVAKQIEAAGHEAAAIHGNKSQGQRQRALDSFRAGRVMVLVATDIAARGIDIDGVSHVVNYELPNVPEAYVHRIGRTARAGRSGVAISLCDPSERGLLKDIEKLIGRRFTADGTVPMEPARAADGPRNPRRRPRRRDTDAPTANAKPANAAGPRNRRAGGPPQRSKTGPSGAHRGRPGEPQNRAAQQQA